MTILPILRILLANCPAQQFLNRNPQFGKDPESADIVLLTETRNSRTTFPTLPGYSLINNYPRKLDNQNLFTGGTAYFCKNSINLTNCTDKYKEYEFDNESLLLKLKLPNGESILIVLYYYSVTYSETAIENMQHLFNNIDDISLACNCEHTLFAGDWNAHIPTILNSQTPENIPGSLIKQFVSESRFNIIQTELPTRGMNKNDFFISDLPYETIIKRGLQLSDHYSIELSLPQITSEPLKPVTRKLCNYSKFKLNSFANDFDSYTKPVIAKVTTPTEYDTAVTKINTWISSNFEKYLPITYITSTVPWDGIKLQEKYNTLINKQEFIEKLGGLATTTQKSELEPLENEYNQQTSEFQKAYNKTKLDKLDSKHRDKEYYDTLGGMTGLSKTKNNNIVLKDDFGETITGVKALNKFGTYWENMFKKPLKITNLVLPDKTIPEEDVIDYLTEDFKEISTKHFHTNLSDDYKKNVNIASVKNKMELVDTTRCAGIDNIPNRILKIISGSKKCVTIITWILYQMFVFSVFPTIYKTARMFALEKEPNSVNCTQYRPLSVQAVIARLAESFISDSFSHICNLWYLPPEMFAYRPRMGCQDSILRLSIEIDLLRFSKNPDCPIYLVMLDFVKVRFITE